MENIYVGYVQPTSKILESTKINYISQVPIYIYISTYISIENVKIKDTKTEEVKRPLGGYDFLIDILLDIIINNHRF